MVISILGLEFSIADIVSIILILISIIVLILLIIILINQEVIKNKLRKLTNDSINKEKEMEIHHKKMEDRKKRFIKHFRTHN